MYIPNLTTPNDLLVTLAQRVRARRIECGWSRAELASRSGVNAETLKSFERTGTISLERLLKLASALGALRGFDQLFPDPVPRTIKEAEHLEKMQARRRGSSKKLAVTFRMEP